MTKTDFRKTDPAFYSGRPGRWDRLTLPAISCLLIDGTGDPNGPGFAAATRALYPLAYALKFRARAAGRDFAVPPSEALWWADDPAAFTRNDRDDWRWRLLLRMPDHLRAADLDAVRPTVLEKLAKKKPGAADPARIAAVRLEPMTEGDCLQTLHVGPYSAEAPVLADLHDRLMPELGLTFAGPHHEVYLSDPRRTAPEKLRTILRQPVRPA
jgi:hypothetical protein